MDISKEMPSGAKECQRTGSGVKRNNFPDGYRTLCMGRRSENKEY